MKNGLVDRDLLLANGEMEVDPHNKRIKMYHVPPKEQILELQEELLNQDKGLTYSKVIFYAKQEEVNELGFISYEIEGVIDGFFQGEDAYICSCFLDSSRNQPLEHQQEERVMEIVQQDPKQLPANELNPDYLLREADEADAIKLAKLYDTVFETYPTPMEDPEYIAEMMNKDVYFTVVEHDEQIISACSADLFPQFNAAEMTDCATLAPYRGKGLLSHQFQQLEEKMKEKGVHTLFSYTRAVSVGMNLINARHGYTYRGRLYQNSNIAGRLEDMNIWVKVL